MQEIVISTELQQAHSAVFGSYRPRRHSKSIDPEVEKCVFYRRPSKRPSRRKVKHVMYKKTSTVEGVFVVNDPDLFSFNVDELTKFSDDDENRLSDSLSSGFYEASDRSSSGSIHSNKSSSSICELKVKHFPCFHLFINFWLLAAGRLVCPAFMSLFAFTKTSIGDSTYHLHKPINGSKIPSLHLYWAKTVT